MTMTKNENQTHTSMKCADCRASCRNMSTAALRRGSSVREPGEPLCEGCSSRRLLMVREVGKLPNNLADIRAKRMPGIGKGLAG